VEGPEVEGGGDGRVEGGVFSGEVWLGINMTDVFICSTS
jgi:hypothetical protein